MGSLSLPRIFQDGLVFQRRQPICIWGKSEKDGITVRVNLRNSSASAIVSNGEWETYLPPLEAGSGFELEIESEDEKNVIRDVAIGEVWLASGQSNMEFLLRDDADAKDQASVNLPDVRCFEVPKISFPGQEFDRDYSEVGRWRKAIGKEALYFTAVGYYFAKKLHGELSVPVGIVNCTWGGISASSFISEPYFTADLHVFLDEAKKVQSEMSDEDALAEYRAFQKTIDELPISNSISNLAPIAMTDELKQFNQKANRLRLSVYSPFRPSGLYETMLRTIAPYTIQGVLWYQGESDEARPELYHELMQALIRCWRNLWTAELPFILVQLAPFEFMVEPLNFVPIREVQQHLTKTTPKVWLVCIMDLGMRYDVHPKKKSPVGYRLALQALSKVYGRAILADSPELEHTVLSGSSLHLSFLNAGSGLKIIGDNLHAIEIFTDGTIVPDPHIGIVRNEVRVTDSSFESAEKITVNFAQTPYCEVNLYNSGDLPAFPFSVEIERTENRQNAIEI